MNMHEQEQRKEREATVEGILDALRSGDRVEGRLLWDQWEQRRIAESDGIPSSENRLEVAVESIGFHIADGETQDVLMYQNFVVEDAINSDTTLSEQRRTALLQRLGEVWAGRQ